MIKIKIPKDETSKKVVRKTSGTTIFFIILAMLLLIALFTLGIIYSMQKQKMSELEYANDNLRKDNIDLTSQNEELQKKVSEPSLPQTSMSATDAQVLAEYSFMFNQIVDAGTKTGITIIMIDNNLELLKKTNNTDFQFVNTLFSGLSQDVVNYAQVLQEYLNFFNANEKVILTYDRQNMLKDVKNIAEQDLQNLNSLLKGTEARINDAKTVLGVTV